MSEANNQATPPENNTTAVSRRKLLNAVTIGMGAIGAAIAGVPILGAMAGKAYKKPNNVWRKVGNVDNFNKGETVCVTFKNSEPLPWDGVAANTASWLRRELDGSFTAFSVNCTHLGCPVQWRAEANLFMCPCHGGVYYSNGDVAGGPPPHALPRYEVRVREGSVEILAEPIPIEVAQCGSSCKCGGVA